MSAPTGADASTTEQLLDIRLRVNGVAALGTAPARRLLSDFLRHDLALTGTHVGCEHGVCGACTVLVDGQPMRSCLMFAVTAQAHEITTVEGIGNDPEAMSPVQQAFAECHGLQCGFCTPGFITTITAYLDENPDPTPEEAREAISGNLCRCTGYQNIVKAVGRAAEIRREALVAARRPRSGLRGRGSAMSTRQFGEKVQRREDPRLLTGNGRYLDDLGHTALAAAFVRSPHAHARVVDVDIDDAWEVDGVEAIYTWDDLTGRVAEPLPVLIPHPALTHARTGYCLAKDEVNHVGEAVVMVVARDRYLAEDAAQRIRVTYEQLPVVVGVDNARSGATLVHDDVPGQRQRPPAPGGRRPRDRHGRRPEPAHPRPGHRAQRVHPHGGQGRLRQVGPRRGLAAPVLLHPDHHRRACRGRRQAGDAAGQGRVHRPRRRRRVRRQDHASLARGGARAVGGPQPGPRGQVDRGPPRALHLQRARARAAAGGDRRLRRRGPPARARREVLARQRRLHALRHHRADHHGHPAPRPLQAGCLPRRVLVALHQHRSRDAVSGRRPPAGVLRHGARDGCDRGAPRPRPRRGALTQLHPARRDALRPRPDVPGRPAAEVRLG